MRGLRGPCVRACFAELDVKAELPRGPFAARDFGISGKQILRMQALGLVKRIRSGTGATPREGHAPQLPEVVGGQLSADWVSLLMGFPVDWTIIGDQDGKTEPQDSQQVKKTE